MLSLTETVGLSSVDLKPISDKGGLLNRGRIFGMSSTNVEASESTPARKTGGSGGRGLGKEKVPPRPRFLRDIFLAFGSAFECPILGGVVS